MISEHWGGDWIKGAMHEIRAPRKEAPGSSLAFSIPIRGQSRQALAVNQKTRPHQMLSLLMPRLGSMRSEALCSSATQIIALCFVSSYGSRQHWSYYIYGLYTETSLHSIHYQIVASIEPNSALTGKSQGSSKKAWFCMSEFT